MIHHPFLAVSRRTTLSLLVLSGKKLYLNIPRKYGQLKTITNTVRVTQLFADCAQIQISEAWLIFFKMAAGYYKIIIIGDPEVGKTALFHKILFKEFISTGRGTLGMDCFEKTFETLGETIQVINESCEFCV